eukprot:TRINITY_DN765_c0_g1_i4.p1 TRINITY_DN765_c0_g1~~TRINITY_DN765_c0_g1_i4.p1  ORF type:complete len:607 (+),score=146.19 TRINITY_DN765_c0_g1_i4:183-2003(+)
MSSSKRRRYDDDDRSPKRYKYDDDRRDRRDDRNRSKYDSDRREDRRDRRDSRDHRDDRDRRDYRRDRRDSRDHRDDRRDRHRDSRDRRDDRRDRHRDSRDHDGNGSSKKQGEPNQIKLTEDEKLKLEAELEMMEQDVESEQEKRRRKRRERWNKLNSNVNSQNDSATTNNSDVKQEHVETTASQVSVNSSKSDHEKAESPILNVVKSESNGGKINDNQMDTEDENHKDDGASSFDMFSESDKIEVIEPSNVKRVREAEPTDDVEGYYRYQIHEVFNNRYKVLGYHGKGVFSSVVRCSDLENGEKEVAIKLLRNNAHMKRTGRKEVKILELLTETDQDDNYNCIRLLDNFVDRDHLALVFESMDCNLRQFIKKHGYNVGLGIKAVRVYSYKLAMALVHLKKNNIIHADIKPDNILLEGKANIKLGDLGSAYEADEAIEPTPLLVSRYYRAPEIILGYDYKFPLDTWSYGCCIYEIATGKIMHKSKDINHHLQMILECCGPISKKMIQHGFFSQEHFNYDFNFLQRVKDLSAPDGERLKVTKIDEPTRDLKEEIINSFSAKGKKQIYVKLFADLLCKCITSDPDKRITPEDILLHPLFNDNIIVKNKV